MQGPTTFSNDGSDIIARQIDVHRSDTPRHPQSSSDRLLHYYDVDRTCQRITKHGFKRVALQFPDELLGDSTAVARMITERTGTQTFILADTSYGSCCVDEVAAEHASADFVVHYGRACLSPTKRLPVMYVFGREDIDAEHCAAALADTIESDQGHDQPLLLMYDVMYSHAADAVKTALASKGFKNVFNTIIRSELNMDIAQPVATAPSSETSTSSTGALRHISLPPAITVQDCTIIFVGENGLALVNVIMAYNRCQVYSYNPRTQDARLESVAVNRMLMRRYLMIQKAKDADVVGIVVGTLGVASYLPLITELQRLIRAHHKKPYLFSVGKPNPAKLGNFLEVDVFVLVACPESTLHIQAHEQSKEYLRPIVTPFELQLALNGGDGHDEDDEDDEGGRPNGPKGWWVGGEYIIDLERTLDGLRGTVEAKEEEERAHAAQKGARKGGLETVEGHDGESSDEEPHYSLVTGTYKQSKKYRHIDLTSGVDPSSSSSPSSTSTATELTQVGTQKQLARIMESSASANYLNMVRTWRGLEIGGDEDEKQEGVVEGRKGCAAEYEGEGDGR
ncbi:Diphthamide biosynthesis protein 2 [Quaeritorhiza haematococci]|nr:Diphthamide biosynthesis protein 2 [Quaeritorhiza haematococci]